MYMTCFYVYYRRKKHTVRGKSMVRCTGEIFLDLKILPGERERAGWGVSRGHANSKGTSIREGVVH